MEQGLQLCAFTNLLTALPGLHWWQSRADEDNYVFTTACSKFVGIQEPLTPQKWHALIHPHDQARRKKVLEHLLLGQESNFTYRILAASGIYEWVQENIRLIASEDAGEAFISTATTCQAPIYWSIFQSTSNFLILTDPFGRLEEVNKTAEQFLGQRWEQAWEEAIWQSTFFAWDHQQVEKIQAAIEQAASGASVARQEWQLNYNNMPFRGLFTIKPIYDPQGDLEYLMIEGSEIIHQKKKNQQAHPLAESIPDVIVRFDRELRYLFANAAIEDFTGHKPEHFIGKQAAETNFPDPGWDGFERCLRKVLETGEMKTYTGEVTTAQHQQISIYSLIVPELDDEGKVCSLLVITRNVSELAEKEKALEQSNARLRAIIEGTRDIVCAFDKDYRVIAFNNACEKEMQRIYGTQVRLKTSIDELLGEQPEELKNAKDLLRRALIGEEFTILQEFGDPQKERHYYEINFSSIRDEAGNIIGASSRTRNISREQEIEKELKDAHEFLVLAENLPQIIFTARPDGQVDFLNHAFFDYTNQPSQNAEQVDWKTTMHPDDFQQVMHQWLEAVKDWAPGLQLELRLRNRYGLYRWHIARAVPIRNSLNMPIKWVGVISDVHEAKIAGERERMAAEEFKSIAESLPHIVWTTRADGSATYFNNKWYDYTGEPARNSRDWEWLSLVHPEDRARTEKAWRRAVKQHGNYQVEYRLRHKSDRYRWFLARGVPITDAEGHVIKWFGTCTDIHENKLQRKRLQTQNDRLNQINQYLDNFVHAAAHDLRSPVANMKGLLQLLRAYGHGTGSKVVQSMETSLHRLDNTLQAMIHSIELQSLKQSPTRALNLEEVFDQVNQEFTERFQGVPHEIHTNFNNCSDLIFIPFYLESLYRNLISNAIKYRREDQHLVIHVNCRSYRKYKLLEFSDNGIGIDVEKFKDKLFKPFQRFTQQATGKGIGLHLIHNIVTKTGGKIEVKSKPGEGTTFLLYLKDFEG